MVSIPDVKSAKLNITSIAAIELGIVPTFQSFADVVALERKARELGAEIEQIKGEGLERGSTWLIKASIRNKQRVFRLEIRDVQGPNFLIANLSSERFLSQTQFTFKQKDTDLTQVKVDLKVMPRTLGARLALHGLRLTRHRQKRRLTRGLRKLCRYLEATHGAKI